MERAALYIRVSTEEQTEFSPAAQEKALLEYANKNNMMVSKEHVFKDVGFSGREAKKRPAFMKMIGLAKLLEKPFDVILVHKFDRFARNREDSIVYKSLLRKECKIKIISITEQMEDDKFSLILESMLDAMAEYYSINLGEEVRKGMTEKAKRGEFQASPPLGYGFDKTNNLAIIIEEAEFIQYIFSEYVHMNRSISRIVKGLNQLGAKSKRGNKIDRRGVEYILANPIYIGKVRWTPTKKVKRNQKCSDTIVEKGTHKAIISEELFGKAQDKLFKRKINGNINRDKTNNCKHWLCGLIKCSNCGSTLVLSQGSKSLSFQCHKYSKGLCEISHSISVGKLENAIFAEFARDFQNIKIDDYDADNTKAYDLKIDLLLKKINRIEKQEIKASEAFLENIYHKKEYVEIRQRLEMNKRAAFEEIERLKRLNLPDNQIQLMYDMNHIVKILKSEIEMEKKQEVMREIVDNITYVKVNKNLEIYYNL